MSELWKRASLPRVISKSLRSTPAKAPKMLPNCLLAHPAIADHRIGAAWRGARSAPPRTGSHRLIATAPISPPFRAARPTCRGPDAGGWSRRSARRARGYRPRWSPRRGARRGRRTTRCGPRRRTAVRGGIFSGSSSEPIAIAMRGVADVAEGERRAAVAAEAALGRIGAPEERELAPRQLELVDRHAGERREERAEGLLAHAAVADVRVRRRRRAAHSAPPRTGSRR